MEILPALECPWYVGTVNSYTMPNRKSVMSKDKHNFLSNISIIPGVERGASRILWSFSSSGGSANEGRLYKGGEKCGNRDKPGVRKERQEKLGGPKVAPGIRKPPIQKNRGQEKVAGGVGWGAETRTEIRCTGRVRGNGIENSVCMGWRAGLPRENDGRHKRHQGFACRGKSPRNWESASQDHEIPETKLDGGVTHVRGSLNKKLGSQKSKKAELFFVTSAVQKKQFVSAWWAKTYGSIQNAKPY